MSGKLVLNISENYEAQILRLIVKFVKERLYDLSLDENGLIDNIDLDESMINSFETTIAQSDKLIRISIQVSDRRRLSIVDD